MGSEALVQIDGKSLDRTIEHFSFGLWHEISDMHELAKLAQFERLTSATFHATGLNDVGLTYVCRVATLENLDLQQTCISNEGLRALAQLPRLQHLRLKENAQLTNGCIPHLLELRQLIDLQIHETSIDQQGLARLIPLGNLRDICLAVSDGNYSFEGLLDISARMPQCAILAKTRGCFKRGVFQGQWDRRQS